MCHSNPLPATISYTVALWLLFAIIPGILQSQQPAAARPVAVARPLETLRVQAPKGHTVMVTDGKDRAYFRAVSGGGATEFTVGGALGAHTIFTLVSPKAKPVKIGSFQVTAETDVDDKGPYKALFDMTLKGMQDENVGQVIWNGKPYRYFVPWILDHGNVMKGLKYFKGYGAEFVDLLAATQRADGMIYSFVEHGSASDYFLTRDKVSGYTQKIGDKYFTRQPTENHPEYMYVNTVYQCWKSSGDDAWLKQTLPSAAKALEYGITDPARWSKRFQLLKRVYTIDSWDFAVEDEYLPNLGLTNSMMIDPVKSKFGIFFGDNTGYIAACHEMAEMCAHTGDAANAQRYRQRGDDFKVRLDQLAWNGRFYTHFIEEDSTVRRKLGVDERSQFAQSNAYSLNRPLRPDQAKAIVESYRQLKNNLPTGSPGEWYSIYPPFQRGFGTHNEIWQYMNGGIGGHVAGELARGAFEHGYETYGADILNRLLALGKQYDNKIYFAYTGAVPPPPPPPVFKTIPLGQLANMDHRITDPARPMQWMNAKRVGDDLRNLPVGRQVLAKIPFEVIDPLQNNSKSVLAVSTQRDFPAQITISIGDTAHCVYLLHTASKPVSENISGILTFEYADGSSRSQYLVHGKHLTYWWYPELKSDHAGVAWYGKNDVTEGCGLGWCAIDNPFPGKNIRAITIKAPENGPIYALFGMTLANREHYVAPKIPSYGGPDNWSAANVLAAIAEGLAGVKDSPKSKAFQQPVVAPRWHNTASDAAAVTICYPASGGYVAYQYRRDRAQKRIALQLTGSASIFQVHLPLPEGSAVAPTITMDGAPVLFTVNTVGASRYANFMLENNGVKNIMLRY